jgi:tetratricopeptide (TPR) repeat protein
MPISNIGSKMSQRHHVTKSQVFLGVAIFVSLLGGCCCKVDAGPGELAKESESYYRQALQGYKSEIAKGKDTDQLYFDLGRLYFDHGAFSEAAESFSKSKLPQAKKFLAISYYRLGDFTGALEVFNKFENTDAEYLYYKGLACEKLNLFDPALESYREIKDPSFASLASERIDAITRQAAEQNIGKIDPRIAGIIDNAPKPEAYPQAGVLILACDEKVEVTAENTQISSLHYLIKILNERGKENFSEAKIDYDSTYEKVEVEYARTIKPDGSIAQVGTRHIRDVSKYLNFPLYSNARVRIISFPEIAEGSCIEYSLKIYRNKLINKKDFVNHYPVQSGEPIISANFVLSFPEANFANLKVINAEYNNFKAQLNPQKDIKDGIVSYRWQFRDLPQIIPESSMPPTVKINPAMLFSSFRDWQELYDWWWPLAKDKIQADKPIKDKVSELIKECKSEDEIARAIYNFCAQEIRYVAVEYGDAGYEPHQAADIFRNKYGDCKDQAVLLVTMLKEAGLAAWPVIIPTKSCYNLSLDFPAMFFDHAIACVKLKEGLIFLDPTSSTCSFGDLPPGDQGRRVFICREDDYKIEETPLYPASHNLARQDIKIKINSDETIAGEKKISTFGVYDQGQRYWLLYTQPELIEAQLKEKIQDFSIGAKLLNYSTDNLDDLNKPVILRYAFSGPEYLTQAGDLRIMPQLTNIDISLTARDKRRYPLELEVLDKRETNFEIAIPEVFVVKYIPKDISKDSPWVKFSARYSFKANTLTLRQELEFKKRVIDQSEYADFKRFYDGLAKDIKQRVVLEKAR